MRRRAFLRRCAACGVLYSAGCTSEPQQETSDLYPELTYFPSVTGSDSSWELTVRVRNIHNFHTTFDNVDLISYNQSGVETCRTGIGDLDDETTVKLTCADLPAIITATADESPCEGARIQIFYWIGTDEQRRTELPGDIKVWESTFRKCDESLPPERVIEKVNTTATPTG